MATCRKCRASIAPDSRACPRCGIARPIVPRWVRLFTGISLGLFVATWALIGIATHVNAPAKPAHPAAVPAEAPPPADESVKARAVTAGELLAAYRANEVAADERYRDQWLVVSGDVAAVRKNADGDVVIHLRGGRALGVVSAFVRDVQREIARAAQLASGDAVELLCKGGGMVGGGVPLLQDCVFFKGKISR